MTSRLPIGWRNVELSEVADIRRGASPRPIKKYISKSGIPWVKIADATASNSRYIKSTKEFIVEEVRDKSVYVEKGTLILSNSATPGLPKIMGINGCVHDGWLVLTNFKHLDKIFLYYMLLDIRRRLVNLSDGSVFKNLNIGIVSKFKINLPSVKEQKAISDTLSSLDNKIENNDKINKNLEQQAQAIFKHWFIDFEFPDENGNPYKSSGGEMVETELGMIPKGWKIKKLGEIMESMKDGTKPGEHLNSRMYIPIDTMSKESVTIQDFKSYQEAKSSLLLFEKYDILIGAMRVYFHRVNLAPCKGVTRTTTFVLRAKDKVDISYNLFLLNLNETIDYANQTSKGTTMPYAIWENGLAEMLIINPPRDSKEDFNNIIFPTLQKMINNSKENRFLTQLRDTLLPKLMSGEIRIPLD